MTKPTPSRRTFLQQSSQALLSLPFLSNPFTLDHAQKTCPFTSLSQNSLITNHPIGIILNTVPEAMKTDYRGTLAQLKNMGYQYLEGGTYGEVPKEYAQYVKELELKVVAGGSSMANLWDNTDQFIETAHLLGYEYITCYWPWRSDATNITKKECMEAVESLNTLGKRFNKEGLGFTWHNHDKEFVEIEGKTVFDWLVQETDPELVNVQMDVYWVRKGKADPVALMKTYAGRIKLLHLKDMDHGEEEEMTCVGNGRLDFEEILGQWADAGVEYATVENEQNKRGIVCAQESIEFLKSL